MSETPEQIAARVFNADDPVIIDVDDLTVGEQMEVEEMSGLPLGAVLDGPTASTKLLHALLYVSARKTHPDITPDITSLAKPSGYGWRLDDDGEGAPKLPTQALARRSLLSYALSSSTLSSEPDDAEIADTEPGLEPDLPDESSPTD